MDKINKEGTMKEETDNENMLDDGQDTTTHKIKRIINFVKQ